MSSLALLDGNGELLNSLSAKLTIEKPSTIKKGETKMNKKFSKEKDLIGLEAIKPLVDKVAKSCTNIDKIVKDKKFKNGLLDKYKIIYTVIVNNNTRLTGREKRRIIQAFMLFIEKGLRD